ncbi:HPr family phosphocarrier protein [bacterium]|jgi:phosphocarrier protein|nr:HPr family phosphocarrier protein [bacterium]MBP5591938.1 HPr family phosphocarrier protein [bacterium]
MKEAELTIKNKLGLHARAASLFVKTAEKFKCGVEMEKDGIRVNAKSIMGILMLAAPLGSTVKISTNGESEEECLAALSTLVETKFGEE